ncbi:Hachiman antiphage defense system protein HamA [Vibrio cyclitrophicus]
MDNDYKKSIFIISAHSGEVEKIGTCFAISKTIIATAYHNIKNLDSYNLYIDTNSFFDGKSIKLNLLYHDDKNDFAVLECTEGVVSSNLKFINYKIQTENEVNLYGYPAQKEYRHAEFSTIITNDYHEIEHLKYSFEINQDKSISNYDGMSGTPVIIDGFVVGIAVYQQESNTLYCVSLLDIMKSDKFKNEGVDRILLLSNETDMGSNYFNPQYVSPYNYPVSCFKNSPISRGIDIGFTFKKWELRKFSERAWEWFIDYAIPYSERDTYKNESVKTVFRAALGFSGKITPTIISELLLHIAIRDVYNTIPLINEAVLPRRNHVFSCSHLVLNVNNLELWIGFSEISNSISDAIAKINSAINELITPESISTEIKLLANKIDPSWPFQDKLSKITNNKISNENKFDKIIIPIFLAVPCSSVNEYDEDLFIKTMIENLEILKNEFSSCYCNEIIDLLDVRLFYFPINEIENFTKAIQEELS